MSRGTIVAMTESARDAAMAAVIEADCRSLGRAESWLLAPDGMERFRRDMHSRCDPERGITCPWCGMYDA